MRASVRDPGRARVHLCGLRACYWRPCSRLGPARGVGAGGYGARWRRAGKSPGVSARLSPPPTRNLTRAAGMRRPSRVVHAGGAGTPGGWGWLAGGVCFAACALRDPATAGRSLRARGAPRGAAILASSLRTRGGLGGRPAGLGVRTSQVQGVTRAGPEGRGRRLWGVSLHPRDGSDFSGGPGPGGTGKDQCVLTRSSTIQKTSLQVRSF